MYLIYYWRWTIWGFCTIKYTGRFHGGQGEYMKPYVVNCITTQLQTTLTDVTGSEEPAARLSSLPLSFSSSIQKRK